MNKPTIASVVKEVAKNKPVNISQMKRDIDSKYPDNDISMKQLNNFLYGEYYDEDYERCLSIRNFY